jgi:hypothetical protein
MNNIIVILYGLILAFIGIICTFFPTKVQNILIKSVQIRFLRNTALEPLLRFYENLYKSDKCLTIYRICGVGALIMACFLVIVLFLNIVR